MRELKFKAWDKEAHQIISWNLLSSMIDGERIRVPERTKLVPVNAIPNKSTIVFERQGNPFKTESFILMQFTGLKDKNGIEVFEGDKVTAWWFNFTRTGTGTIKYENGGFYIGIMPLGDFEQLEVIGNIYENSELLK